MCRILDFFSGVWTGGMMMFNSMDNEGENEKNLAHINTGLVSQFFIALLKKICSFHFTELIDTTRFVDDELRVVGGGKNVI